MDVVVIAVCGVIGGCSGPTAIHRWSTLHEKWLRQHLPLANGLPSRDCIRRLLMMLKPEAFQKCFQAWTAASLAGRSRRLAHPGRDRRQELPRLA